jgi:probable rRNA maturation factor
LVIFRKRIAGLSRSTLERFVSRARRAVHLRDTVNVLVTNSRELRALNRRFRGADKSTDVLSFPSPPLSNLHAQRVAGEVAISADIARDNADGLGHSLAEEVKILVLHGVLHLAGFDHEHDRGEMARKESQLRRRLNLQDSLIARAAIGDATIGRATTERAQLRGTKSVTSKEYTVRKSGDRRRNP